MIKIRLFFLENIHEKPLGFNCMQLKHLVN
jgi:hypothetical protein